MTSHRVFPWRRFCHSPVRAGSLISDGVGAAFRRPGEWPIQIHDPSEPQPSQMGNAQLHLPREIAERVAPLVAVRSSIRQLAAADAVENDQEDAPKSAFRNWR